MGSKFSPTPAVQKKPAVCKPPPSPLPPPPGLTYGPVWIGISWKGSAPDPPNPDREYNYTDAAWVPYSIPHNLYRIDFTHGPDSMRISITPEPGENRTNLVTTHWISLLPPLGASWYATLILPGALWHDDHLYTVSQPYPARFFYHLHT